MAIYLDSNATTRVHPEVVEAMLPYFSDNFHNPSAGYVAGQGVKSAVETARKQVADLIGARPEEIVFTGCGTESNNMALKSMARQIGRKNSKILTSQIEHSAVLRPIEAMEAVGFIAVRIGTDETGRLRLEEFTSQLESDRPGFASVMWANNESGVIQPIADVCALAKSVGWLVHSDAINAAGKVPVRVDEVPVDLLSISGHKFHAPKGVGALFVREGTPFEPMIRGGGQEAGRRSGTENVPYIVGLGAAAALMKRKLDSGESAAVAKLRNNLEQQLTEVLDGVHLNGHREHRTGNVAHISIDGCRAAEMLPLLDRAGVQCSAGSACMTGKAQPSHVQKAMGFSDERAFSSLRISLSIFTTQEEIDEAAGVLVDVVKQVREKAT
ncbi:MAG: cysteine desulfurase [Verrucomicrobiales bacterium]|nr:cysteine desulfurase [Verrucomicrobiales bacterium]